MITGVISKAKKKSLPPSEKIIERKIILKWKAKEVN